MLASLLPGLRDLRTPLAAGYAWLLAVWIVQGRIIVEAVETSPGLEGIRSLGAIIGSATILTVASFAAYLIGSIIPALSPTPGERFEEWLAADLAKALPARLAHRRRSNERGFGGPSLQVAIRDRLAPAVDSDGYMAAFNTSALPADSLKSIIGEIMDHQFFDNDPEYAASPVERRREIVKYRFSDTLLNEALRSVAREREILATRLQVERATLWDQYDRIQSEVELRLSLVLPLIATSLALAVAWSPWALFGLLVPMGTYGDALKRRRAATEILVQAVIAGLVSSPTIESLLGVASENAPTPEMVARRNALIASIDQARTLLVRAQIHRHYASNVPENYFNGRANVAKDVGDELVKVGVLRFVDAMTAAREAIADIDNADIQKKLGEGDSWEISEEKANELSEELASRRRSVLEG